MLYDTLYKGFIAIELSRTEQECMRTALVQAFTHQFISVQSGSRCDGWARMQKCRQALDAVDRMGWQRSFHQKQFHDQFMRASARIYWKAEKHGQFQRDHKRILELNGWDSLPQELLVSTPRRFGKTISVSMFAAALIYSAAKVEVSIYSTCKRISQKLLRNIWKFIEIIFDGLKETPYKVLRMNMEEIVLQGPEGPQDVRIVNSYPSKVRHSP